MLRKFSQYLKITIEKTVKIMYYQFSIKPIIVVRCNSKRYDIFTIYYKTI